MPELIRFVGETEAVQKVRSASIAGNIGVEAILSDGTTWLFVASMYGGGGIYYTIDSIKIYQSQNPPGLDKYGDLAPDLYTNDKTYSQLSQIGGVVPNMAAIYDQYGVNPLIDDMKALSNIAIASPSMSSVFWEMTDYFIDGSGSDYANLALTANAVNHSSTENYIEESKQAIIDYLENNPTNLGLMYISPSFSSAMSNTTRPKFTGFTSWYNGLLLCIHDTWGVYIELEDYAYNGYSFSGTLKYSVYDHFGLDDSDMTDSYLVGAQVRYSYGFAAWYVLQHYKSCNDLYQPYITWIEFEVPFSGTT